MRRRVADYTLAFFTSLLALTAETWQWVRLSRRGCRCEVVPMSDGTACALCGKFTPWHEPARCRDCGAFL